VGALDLHNAEVRQCHDHRHAPSHAVGVGGRDISPYHVARPLRDGAGQGDVGSLMRLDIPCLLQRHLPRVQVMYVHTGIIASCDTICWDMIK
jgi:hypothetical protein